MGKLAITFPSMVLLALGFPGACGPSCAGSGGGGDGGVSDTSAAGGDWKRAHDAFLAALDAGVPDIDVEGDGRTHLVRTFRGAQVLTSAWKVDGVVYARDDYSTGTIRHELYGDDASLELIVEETPTSSDRGPISIRKTYLAADRGVPYLRESYEWDGASSTVTVTTEEDVSHAGGWMEISTREEAASDFQIVLAFTEIACLRIATPRGRGGRRTGWRRVPWCDVEEPQSAFPELALWQAGGDHSLRRSRECLWTARSGWHHHHLRRRAHSRLWFPRVDHLPRDVALDLHARPSSERSDAIGR